MLQFQSLGTLPTKLPALNPPPAALPAACLNLVGEVIMLDDDDAADADADAEADTDDEEFESGVPSGLFAVWPGLRSIPMPADSFPTAAFGVRAPSLTLVREPAALTARDERADLQVR